VPKGLLSLPLSLKYYTYTYSETVKENSSANNNTPEETATFAEKYSSVESDPSGMLQQLSTPLART
jgi:hypothetical protein